MLPVLIVFFSPGSLARNPSAHSVLYKLRHLFQNTAQKFTPYKKRAAVIDSKFAAATRTYAKYNCLVNEIPVCFVFLSNVGWFWIKK